MSVIARIEYWYKEARRGEARRGEARRGEARRGEAQKREAKKRSESGAAVALPCLAFGMATMQTEQIRSETNHALASRSEAEGKAVPRCLAFGFAPRGKRRIANCWAQQNRGSALPRASAAGHGALAQNRDCWLRNAQKRHGKEQNRDRAEQNATAGLRLRAEARGQQSRFCASAAGPEAPEARAVPLLASRFCAKAGPEAERHARASRLAPRAEAPSTEQNRQNQRARLCCCAKPRQRAAEEEAKRRHGIQFYVFVCFCR